MTASARLVLAWLRAYTWGLPADAAADRRAELRSDLWEQQADPAGSGSSMLRRALRGAPADLAWRREVLRDRPDARVPLSLRWRRDGLLAALAAEAGVLTVVAATAVGLSMRSPALLGGSADGVIVADAAALVLVVAGSALLTRRGTRFLAPAALGAGAVILLALAPVLVRTSTLAALTWTTSPLAHGQPGWDGVAAAAVVLTAVFHLAVAVAWLPDRSAMTAVSQR